MEGEDLNDSAKKQTNFTDSNYQIKLNPIKNQHHIENGFDFMLETNDYLTFLERHFS